MQILFWSILTVLEPNIGLFPLHFHKKNLPQNHANLNFIDFDCFGAYCILLLYNSYYSPLSRCHLTKGFWREKFPQNHANLNFIDFDCLEPSSIAFSRKKSSGKIMQIFLLSKLTEKTLITKKIFKFASLGRPSASLAPLEIKCPQSDN